MARSCKLRSCEERTRHSTSRVKTQLCRPFPRSTLERQKDSRTKKNWRKFEQDFVLARGRNETKVELISSTFFVWPDFSWAAAALLPPPARTGPGRSPPARAAATSSTTTTTILFREKATPAEKKSNDV